MTMSEPTCNCGVYCQDKGESCRYAARPQDKPERPPGINPKTGEYSTAQMLYDEMYGGDTSQPLFD